MEKRVLVDLSATGVKGRDLGAKCKRWSGGEYNGERDNIFSASNIREWGFLKGKNY